MMFLLLTQLIFRGATQVCGAHVTSTLDVHKESERLPVYGILTIAMILLAIGAEWGIGFWGAQFIELQLAKAPEAAVTMMAAFFGGTFVGRIAASRLLRVFSVKRMLVTLILVGGLSVAVMAASNSENIVWGALFFSGASLGNYFPLILSAANDSAPGYSTAISRYATVAVGLALLTVPIVIGKLSAWIALPTIVGLLALLPMGMLFLYFFSERMSRNYERVQEATDNE